jgi:hypothetical protein
MTVSPIEEIKRIRHQLGADADFDIHRVFAELRASQASSGRTYIQHAPRRVAGNNSMHQNGETERPEVENP